VIITPRDFCLIRFLGNTTKGALVMKKKKSNFELMKEIRGTWTLNPVTRVHDNNIKKNIKKNAGKERIYVNLKKTCDQIRKFFYKT
jgi:hypothetical protein